MTRGGESKQCTFRYSAYIEDDGKTIPINYDVYYLALLDDGTIAPVIEENGVFIVKENVTVKRM